MTKYYKSSVWFALLTGIILSGCAASYTPVKPEARKYTSTYTSPDSAINYAYKYDVLSIMENKRYSKKEQKAGVSVLTVRIQNNTDSVIKFSDLRIFQGNNQVIPVSNLAAANKVKQPVWPYVFYSLLVVYIDQGVSMDNNGNMQQDYIAIPIGIPIAAGNMIGAGSANSNLRNEFVKYDLSSKSINPHETIYGIMVLQGFDHQPVRFELPATRIN